MPFDIEQFESAIKEKAAARPDLAAPMIAHLALTIVIVLAGLVLLGSRIRARGAVPPPPGPPVAPGWGLIDVVAVFAAMLLLAQPLGYARKDLEPFGRFAAEILPSALLFALVVSLIALIVALRGQGARALGLTRAGPGSPPAPAVGLRFLVMAFPLFSGASFLAREAFKRLGAPRTPNPAAEIFLTTDSLFDLAGIAVTAIAIMPLLEEIIFRGFLYPALRAKLGRGAGVALSAFFFASVHPPVDMVPILILGAAFALAYERAGSLWAPIAAHALNNAWSMVQLAAMRYVHNAS